MDDGALVRRIREGDRAAFEALIVRHHRRLFLLAHGILRDPHASEDATQQAFVEIWRDLGSLRDLDRFEAWSYRVLVRVCYRESRRQRAWERSVGEGVAQLPAPADPLGSVIDRDRLERAFLRLSVDHRTVVAMRYLLEMSPEQIGEVLAIPRRTVYSRLKRALPALRAALEADDRLDVPRLDAGEATG